MVKPNSSAFDRSQQGSGGGVNFLRVFKVKPANAVSCLLLACGFVAPVCSTEAPPLSSAHERAQNPQLAIGEQGPTARGLSTHELEDPSASNINDRVELGSPCLDNGKLVTQERTEKRTDQQTKQRSSSGVSNVQTECLNEQHVDTFEIFIESLIGSFVVSFFLSAFVFPRVL